MIVDCIRRYGLLEQPTGMEWVPFVTTVFKIRWHASKVGNARNAQCCGVFDHLAPKCLLAMLGMKVRSPTTTVTEL